MKLFKLTRTIDGYGVYPDIFFYDFSTAIKAVQNTSCIYYDAENNKYDIYGMKAAMVNQSEDNFSLYGIRFPEKDFDQFSIEYCKIVVEAIELPFDINSNKLYALGIEYGYRNYCLTRKYKKSFILQYAPTKKKAKKLSKFKEYKKYPRIWNNKDEPKYSIFGDGGDYLIIKSFDVYKEEDLYKVKR